MRRKVTVTLAALVLLTVGLGWAVTEPPAEQALVSCQQYRFDDGDCWTICHFFGANGENQGYVISYTCN